MKIDIEVLNVLIENDLFISVHSENELFVKFDLFINAIKNHDYSLIYDKNSNIFELAYFHYYNDFREIEILDRFYNVLDIIKYIY